MPYSRKAARKYGIYAHHARNPAKEPPRTRVCPECSAILRTFTGPYCPVCMDAGKWVRLQG